MLQLTFSLPFLQCPSPSTSVFVVVNAAPCTPASDGRIGVSFPPGPTGSGCSLQASASARAASGSARKTFIPRYLTQGGAGDRAGGGAAAQSRGEHGLSPDAGSRPWVRADHDAVPWCG